MANILEFELGGDYAEALDNLGQMIKGKLLRSGGNAGSELLQDEAKLRAPYYKGVVRKTKAGRNNANPGQLRDSIYRAYNKRDSTPEKAVYTVSYNHRRAPHGWWMEYGNSRHPAKPFLTPAFEARKNDSIEAGRDRIRKRYESIIGGGE